MSRGVVLWPDRAVSEKVSEIWRELENAGLPSLAGPIHRLHRPHVSLIVAGNLDPQATLKAVGLTPRASVPLLVSSVGVFPGEDLSIGQYVLFLVVVANEDLLTEQRRVSEAVLGLAQDPWEHFDPGGWTAHLTLGVCYSKAQLGQAIPLVLAHLPLIGSFDRGGVEDGDSGESWASRPSLPGGPGDHVL